MENKGRRLTTYQYFEALQVEWVVANLRTKIYRSPKDKEYWTRVKENKKVKIEEISNRNSLPNIFTDTSFREEIERRVFNEYSFPNFHYKDEDHKLTQGYYDLLYYYFIGSEVTYNYFGETKVGRIAIYTPFEPHCFVVDLKDEENGDEVSSLPMKVDINCVKRIL